MIFVVLASLPHKSLLIGQFQPPPSLTLQSLSNNPAYFWPSTSSERKREGARSGGQLTTLGLRLEVGTHAAIMQLFIQVVHNGYRIYCLLWSKLHLQLNQQHHIWKQLYTL